LRVEIESVNSVNAAPKKGYKAAVSPTFKTIFEIGLVVITEEAQGFTTVSVKLDGATSVGEVPYVIPSTTTYYT
jgi:hypothetical protein